MWLPIFSLGLGWEAAVRLLHKKVLKENQILREIKINIFQEKDFVC